MRSVITVIVALMLLTVVPGMQQQVLAQEYQDWKFMHPKPHANLLRKIKMLDANIWFAVGGNGTFQRTTDGGANWYLHHQAGKFANTAQTIGQNYDVWYLNAATGIVAGDRGYIGRTTNGGATFDSVANGLIPVAQRAQSIWFANSTTGFVAAGTGSGFNGTIVKTTDGGLNWTVVYTTTATTVQAVTGTNAQTVYALLADGAVIKSTDGGTSWSTPTPGTVGSFMYTISFVDSLTGLAAGSGGLISKTTNAGATWTPITPLQTDFAYFQTKIVSPTEIYLVGHPTTLYKSTDVGATWAPLPISVTGPAITFIWYSLDKQGSVMTLSGDYGIVAKSTDNGSTWNANSTLLNNQLMFDIQRVPNTNTMVAVGRQFNTMQRQVLRSTNMGGNWTPIDIPVATDLQGVSFVNSQVGYACGTNSQVVKTTDAGLTWTAVTRPHATNYTLQTIEFLDSNTGWVAVNFSAVTGGNIFKTTDGGTTWTQQTIGTTDQIAKIDIVDANIGYLCLNPSNRPIYKTTNGGSTWTAVTQPFTGQIRDIDAVDANNVYIVTSSGTNRVGKSTDGGATWTQIALPITVDCNSLDFRDVNNGYLTGNSTTVVCKTTNAGASWTFQNVHLPTLVGVYAGPGDTTWALGTTASILRWAGTPPPQAVTRTIGGTSPDYPTIKAAINAINAQGVPAGGVTFLIRGGTYNEDSLRIRTSTAGPSAPIVFRPDSGATVVVNVTPPSTAYNFVFSVDTTNNVTFNGIPVGGSATDRNLTINALGTNGQVGIRIYGNSDNCTVQNVVISCSGLLTSTSVRGVDIRYSSASTQIPDGSVVRNVYIKRAGYGVFMQGWSVSSPMMTGVIENCSFATGATDSMGVNGINISSITGASIRNNTIRNIYGTSGVSGIAIGSQTSGAQIFNNSIATIRTTGTGSAVTGIQQSATTDFGGNKFYNNMISDLAGVATGTGAIYGLSFSAGSNTNPDTVYHNSVYLTGTGTGARISAGLGLVYFGGTPTVVARNNVFVNTRQEGTGVNSFATTIYKAIVNATLISDYNNLYVSATPDTNRATAVYFISTNNYSKYPTIGDFRIATNQDINSIAENPPFVSATDLHINAATPTNLESSGTALGIATDIDGQTRNGATPDLGADEGSFTFLDGTAPLIVHTPLPPSGTTAGRVASATITDRTGVATATGAPRLWHKNSTDPTYTAATVDSIRGNIFYFTIPGRITGTTVQYYLAAQDNAPANNVGTWPAGGSGINPPGSTPPSRIFSYLVQAPLAAGTYTIGVGGNFPTLDSAFRKLTVDGIAGAVTFNLTDTGYVAQGKPRRIIKDRTTDQQTAIENQFHLYEYEAEDAATIALQTLTGPIIGAGPSSRVTFRPAPGRTVNISGTGTFILRLLDVSYVTIDGINSGGSTLTIRNISGNGLVIEGNSDNNIVQNVAFASRGIGSSSVNLQSINAERTPDQNLIQNNMFIKGWVGVAVNASQALGYATGNRISRNLMKITEPDSLNLYGIFFQNAAGTLIDNNEISVLRNMITTARPAGIYGSGKHRRTRIWNNVISDIVHFNGGSPSAVYGIYSSATAGETTRVAIYNNMISNIDDQTFMNGLGSHGIAVTNGIFDTVAYNSVYLSGPEPQLSSAFYNAFLSPTQPERQVWRNNVGVNLRVPSHDFAATFAFFMSDTDGEVLSNYNDLYVPPGINRFIAGIQTGGGSYSTLLGWQAATGRDLNSVSVPVNFRGAPDLHVDSTIATSINNAGTPIAGFGTDFDGQARNATTPDMGADEFGGIALTRDIGVAAVQEIVPAGSFVSPLPGNGGETKSYQEDITSPSSALAVEGAVIKHASGNELLFEVLADTVSFRAFVRNYGTLAESTYQVRWSLDGVVQATVNNTRVLGAGRLDSLVLQWNNATPGTHVLRAWTLLAADPNRLNDTTTATIVGPATVPAGIYNNGPIITSRMSASGVAAPAGFRWSELQAVGNDANSLLGIGDGLYGDQRFRLADDFIVPVGQTWRIDSLITYSFENQNGGFATPFTAANLRIWRGAPDSAGSTVVFGDTLTNRLTTSYNSRIYRISNTTTPAPGTPPDLSRVLYQNTLSAGITLVPGRYFIDWQTFTTLFPLNGHFSPMVTVPNRRGNAAWNARQRTSSGWATVLDTGIPSAAPDSAQDLPFVLMGTTGTVPAHDIGVASAVQLPSPDTVKFRAFVWNFGASPESTYQVRWSIDGTVQATINNSRVLAVGGIDTVFINWGAATPGNHTLRAWTLLGTDANRTNDTVTVRFTVSAGWTFNNSGTGSVLNSVKAVNRNIGWVGGNNATVLRTTDGGVTWVSRSTTTITGDVYAIEALSDSIAFVTTTPAGSATRIFRTTNGGTSWTSVFTQSGGFIDAIKMYNATTGIALGDPVTGKWTILKTTNGGSTWTRIATEPSAAAGVAGLNNSLATFDTTHIWFGTTDGRVFRSTDAGLTWSSAATTITGEVDEVTFNGPLFGVAGGQNAASRTTDGGITWQNAPIPGTGYVLGLSTTGNDFWAAMGDNVYRSTNRGAIWTQSYTGTIGTLRHLDFTVAGTSVRGWAVSGSGGIAAALLSPTDVKDGNDKGIPAAFALEQNYPNPFNPATTIEYALPQQANVSLKIYNLLGQLIATLVDETMVAGYHSIVWNGKNDFGNQIATGVYFYRIEARPTDDGQPFTNLKKMLLIK